MSWLLGAAGAEEMPAEGKHAQAQFRGCRASGGTCMVWLEALTKPLPVLLLLAHAGWEVQGSAVC